MTMMTKYSRYLFHGGVCRKRGVRDSNDKALLVILRMHGYTQTRMTSGRAGAMRANTWQTCGIKMEMVMVTVVAILIDDHQHMERL